MQFMVMAAQLAMGFVGGVLALYVGEYFGLDSGALAFTFFAAAFTTSYVVTILAVRMLQRTDRRLLRQKRGEDFDP